MTDHSAPEDFIEQVKQALDHLYDFSHLQRLPLAGQVSTTFSSGDSPGSTLRRELIHAIEALNPGSDVFYRSPDGRLYNLLNLHYIGRMTITEVCIELGISERQAYRDLKRGQTAIADVLWSRCASVEENTGSVQTEIDRLKGHFQSVDVRELLKQAYKAVEKLAAQNDRQLVLEQPDSPVLLTMTLPIAQQVFIHLLSYCVKLSCPGEILIHLKNGFEGAFLEVALEMGTDEPDHSILDQLISQLHWNLFQESEGKTACLTLEMVSKNRTLLVIDDNEGVVELITRYISGYPCHVLSCQQSSDGLELARKSTPDVILLDIMMPDMDGWELLQRLRSLPETEHIPVIVCSVLHDPELAYSLSASQVIPKPVTQENLLNALHELNII
ncbi:MAG: response regulator [Anaerolineae bacterium]|nr:response regulator [Anaerolineae bacterium]